MSWFIPFVLLVVVSLAEFIMLLLMRQHLKKLGGTLSERKTLVDNASKLLIEKHLALSEQNARLERALEVKSDFVGVASHQLRTPITEISWNIESMIGGSAGKFTPEQEQRIHELLQSTKKMIRLIDELLQFVEAEAGYREHKAESVDMEKLIKNVVKNTESRFVHKKMHMEYNFAYGSTPLAVDPEMIEVAIGNLVANAFHYTPESGVIRVATKKEGPTFLFTISDTGIGIPKNKQGLIFEKFQRSLEALKMHSGGIGLGLYITKNIIEQHKGAIRFESAEGKGTTFFVTLPAR